MKCIYVLWHGISSKNPFSVVWPAIKLALVTLVNGCHKNEVDCWTHWQTTNWLTFSFWRVDGWQVYCVETAIFTSHTKTLGREAAAWILLPHFHAHEITLKTNGTWPKQKLPSHTQYTFVMTPNGYSDLKIHQEKFWLQSLGFLLPPLSPPPPLAACLGIFDCLLLDGPTCLLELDRYACTAYHSLKLF